MRDGPSGFIRGDQFCFSYLIFLRLVTLGFGVCFLFVCVDF